MFTCFRKRPGGNATASPPERPPELRPEQLSEQRPPRQAISDKAVSAAGALDELVIHDLLNPMTAVLGQLELLQDQLDTHLSDGDRQRLGECMASARDLSDMLVDLRYLTQIQSAVAPPPPANRSVQAIFQGLCADDTWPAAWSIDATIPSAHAALQLRDGAGLVQRALHVLVRAAARLSAAQRVELAATPTAGGPVRIACRYVGVTLPQEVREKLFTAEIASLQRRHGLRVERARAMELVRHIMMHLGGSVTYEPTADGGAFVITVPQADRSSSPQQAARSSGLGEPGEPGEPGDFTSLLD